jgi:hypothetical protein
MESLDGCRACAWRGLKSSATYEQNLELTLMESLGRLPRLRLARPPRGRSSLLEWSSVLELGYRSRSPTEKNSYEKRRTNLCVSHQDKKFLTLEK